MAANSRVAPHAGAWIETPERVRTAVTLSSPLTQGRGLKHETVFSHIPKSPSPLTQGRGLKHLNHVLNDGGIPSPLTQGRGLKHKVLDVYAAALPVAPHAGAWIETQGP